MDFTVLEFANTARITEDVEDLQIRLAIEDKQYGYEHQPGSPTIDDDHGYVIAMTFADQRRAQEEQIAQTTIDNEEQGEGRMDTTASPTITTTTAGIVITAVTTATAPPAAMNPIAIAMTTINRGGVGALPIVGQTLRSR